MVAGWIENRGRILLTKRPAGSTNGELWEFPGGKVEEGESLQEALRREIREELAITVIPGRPLVTVCHRYPHATIHLTAVSANAPSKRLRALGCSEWRWLSIQELVAAARYRHLQLAPADARLIGRLFGFSTPCL